MEDTPLKSLSRNRVLYDDQLINKIYKGSELIWEADFKPDLNGIRYAGLNDLREGKQVSIALEKSNGYEFPVVSKHVYKTYDADKNYISWFDHDGQVTEENDVGYEETEVLSLDDEIFFKRLDYFQRAGSWQSFNFNTYREFCYKGAGKNIFRENQAMYASLGINHVIKLKNGNFVLGMYSGVVLLLGPDMQIITAAPIKYDLPPENNISGKYREIIGLHEMKDGNIYALTGEGKAVIFKPDLTRVSESKLALKTPVNNSDFYLKVKFVDDKPVVIVIKEDSKKENNVYITTVTSWVFDRDKTIEAPKADGASEVKIWDYFPDNDNPFLTSFKIAEKKYIAQTNSTLTKSNLYRELLVDIKSVEVKDNFFAIGSLLIKHDFKTNTFGWALDINDYYKFDDINDQMKFLITRKLNKEGVVVDENDQPTGDEVDDEGRIIAFGKEPERMIECQTPKYISFDDQHYYSRNSNVYPKIKPETALIKDFVIDKDGVIYIIGNFDHILRFEQYKKII